VASVYLRDIKNNETVNKIAEKYIDEYEHIGIRIQEMPSEVGKELTHNSHIWDDGNDTGEELDGVCALEWEQFNRLDMFALATGYAGPYVLILGTYSNVEYGNDPAEIIMRSPVVLACIKFDKEEN
jgi:hypothetical protein